MSTWSVHQVVMRCDNCGAVILLNSTGFIGSPTQFVAMCAQCTSVEYVTVTLGRGKIDSYKAVEITSDKVLVGGKVLDQLEVAELAGKLNAWLAGEV